MSYSALGLSRNPFAVDLGPVEDAALFMDHVDVAEPGRADGLVQIVGPRGAGKTSQIAHWRRRQPGPYVHVEPDRSRWSPPPVAPVSYWDEADRIPTPVLLLSLRRARVHGAVIVAATHRDLGGVARAAGMRVRNVDLPEPEPARVVAWARHHIERAALGPTSLEVTTELAESVLVDCGASWRVIGDRLHSWAARMARRTDQAMIEAISDVSASDRPRHVG